MSLDSRACRMPADLAARVKALGNDLSQELLDGTHEIYRPLLQAQDWSGIAITRDVAYGPDAERNLLDVHVPREPNGASVMFFHGGGLVRGYKNEDGDLTHGNVVNFFAGHGMIGLNATYRLAPDAPWPEGSRDVGTALAWARDHVADYGGDPEKIFLMGHSAGATHIAGYVFRPEMHPNGEGAGCRGVLLISGVYEAGLDDQRPNQLAYYGDDPARYAEMSTIGNADWAAVPVFMSIAEFEPARFQKKGIRLMAELVVKHDMVPRIKFVVGHNHQSQLTAIGTGDPSLEPDILDFVQEHMS
jgi:acetyl esterase/lipase